MIRRYLAGACAAFTLAAFGSSALAADKCSLVKIGEEPVTMVGLRPTIVVKVNGADARLLVDSGAFFSMLTPKAAQRLSVKPNFRAPQGVRVRGIGGEETVALGKARDFTITELTIRNVDFLVGGARVADGLDGILGQNIIGGVEIEYDLANGLLRLFRAFHCENAVIAYWATKTAPNIVEISRMTPTERHITGPAKVNGQPIRVMFDTGASRSLMERRTAERLGVKRTGDGVVSGGLSGGFGRRMAESWIAPVDSFEIGDESVRHTRLRIADIDLDNADMLIGADFFLSHRVMISSTQRRLYFTYNGGPVFRLDQTNTDDDDAAAKTETRTAEAAAEPKDAASYSRRAAASMARRDAAAAIADLTKAVQLEPNEPRHLIDRSRARMMTRQPALAIADLDQVLKLRPDDRDALLMRARLYLMTGRDADARADIDAVLRPASADLTLRSRIASLYLNVDRFEASIAEWDKVVAASAPGLPTGEALNHRCWVRAVWGKQLETALADCDQAIKLGYKSADVLDSRGLTHLRLGQFDAAIADYDAALRLAPKEAWSLYGRGVAKTKKGLTAAGAADLKAADAVDPNIERQAKHYGIGT